MFYKLQLIIKCAKNPFFSKKKGVLLLFLTALFACTPRYASLEISLVHSFGKDVFALDKPYSTLLGDTIAFSKLKYYLTNIKLIDELGEQWAEKESYRLINFENGGENNHIITLKIDSIPIKKYQTLAFGLGIDSTRNGSGRQINDLDPLKGMFWTWEDGYVFWKAEGYFYPDKQNKTSFVVHVGKNENYQTKNITLKKMLLEGNKYKLTLKVATEKFFGGYPDAPISLSAPKNKKPLSIMVGEKAKNVGENLKNMISE